MQVTLLVLKDSYMVIVAGAHKVGGLALSIGILYVLASVVALFMQGGSHVHPLDGYVLDGDASLLVEPNRVLVEIAECLLDTAILVDTLLENSSHSCIDHFVKFQLGIDGFSYRVDRLHSYGFYTTRHSLQ